MIVVFLLMDPVIGDGAISDVTTSDVIIYVTDQRHGAANATRYVTGLGRVQSGMLAPQPHMWVGTGLPPNFDGNGQFMSACAATEHRWPGMQLIRVRAM